MSTEQYRDITTVVSIVPYRVSIDLPTVYPGRYELPEPAADSFSHVHIRRGRTDRYVGGPVNNGVVSLPLLSEEIAEAIVKDHIRANICVVVGIAEPGLFVIPGMVSEPAIKVSQQLSKAREKQKNWFTELVKQADSDFQRTHSTKAVGRLAKKAANFLNLRREWNVEGQVEESEVIKCPMCMALVSPHAIVCMTCKFILKKEEYEKAKANFANA